MANNGAGEKRVAVVTGTSRGIGLACARALLDAESLVVGVDTAAPDDSMKSETSYHHEQCDITDSNALVAVVEGAAKKFGRLDTLVNNAGVHPVTRSIDDVSPEEFLRLFEINVVSAFVACRAALPHLRSSGGSIVNIASLVGLVGQEGAVDYCTTKAALTGLTKALALDEAQHGVRVNCVCPGAILTPLAQSLNSAQQLQTVASWAWMERMGTPQEVAEVVVFLANSATFVTGQDVVVAGGAELGYGVKGAAYYRAMAPA